MPHAARYAPSLPKSDLFVEVLFPPADSFDGHFEYVEDIYRRVQHAWQRDSEQEVGDTLSLLIDQDDPFTNIEKDGRTTMYRVSLDRPVLIEGVGEVDSDLWIGGLLRNVK